VPIQKIVATNTIRIRKALGLSQRELCTRAELTQAQLSLIENAKSKMSIIALERLSKALGVSTYELLKDPKLENQSLKQKLEEIESLPADKKKSLFTMIDVYLREHKLQEVAKGK
jgi:transcriptional regulator with XRE-family HTH domain